MIEEMKEELNKLNEAILKAMQLKKCQVSFEKQEEFASYEIRLRMKYQDKYRNYVNTKARLKE